MAKIILGVLVSIFLIIILAPKLVYAEFGYDNPYLPRLTAPTPTVIAFNNNTGSVNNSIYWDGHGFSYLNETYVPYVGAINNVDLGNNSLHLNNTIFFEGGSLVNQHYLILKQSEGANRRFTIVMDTTATGEQVDDLGETAYALTNDDTSELLFNINYHGSIWGNRFTSTVADGTAPYNCTSTTLNTNLNADLLDGFHASSLGNSSWNQTKANELYWSINDTNNNLVGNKNGSFNITTTGMGQFGNVTSPNGFFSRLYDSAKLLTMDLDNKLLYDLAEELSVDFNDRKLYASDGSDVILDWYNSGSADFVNTDIKTTGSVNTTKVITTFVDFGDGYGINKTSSGVCMGYLAGCSP